MRLLITTQDGNVFPIDVADDMTLEDFFALCKCESEYLKRIFGSGTNPSSRQSAASWRLTIFFAGKSFSDIKMTLKEVGLKSDDILMVRVDKIGHSSAGSQGNASTNPFPSLDFSSIRPPSNAHRPISAPSNAAASTHPSTPLVIPTVSDQDIRDLYIRISQNSNSLAVLRNNEPELARAVEEQNFDRFATIVKWQHEQQRKAFEERVKILSDPLSSEAQALLLENIHRQQIDEHMQIALEHTPESFATVHMLYIKCKINGHDIKAFVDCGAQTTIMSESCAKSCNVYRLIDKRFVGLAKGVGTSKILGRLHVVQLQIDKDFLSTSCSIIENQNVDLLLGLDMMKRHECVIDLKRNVFIVGTTGTSTPFLPESELPSSVFNDDLDGSAAEAANPHATVRPEDVLKLQQMGFDRNDAELALRNASGDLGRAATMLAVKSPKK